MEEVPPTAIGPMIIIVENLNIVTCDINFKQA